VLAVNPCPTGFSVPGGACLVGDPVCFASVWLGPWLSGKLILSSEPGREVAMENRVLVAYATKHGSTAEIAGRIGEMLQREGLAVDVQLASQVRDLSPYGAVVLGSAVYIGRWRKEAVRFLKGSEGQLAERTVWIFSSGPTGEGDPAALTQGWRAPKSLQPVIDRVHPRDVAVFHGKVDVKTLSFFERWMVRNVRAPIGDFRDWAAISTWARAIAGALKAQDTPE